MHTLRPAYGLRTTHGHGSVTSKKDLEEEFHLAPDQGQWDDVARTIHDFVNELPSHALHIISDKV